MWKLAVSLCCLLALGGLATNSFAVPNLQLYLEGSTYDQTSETWVLKSPEPFKLWVIGYGGVYDVKLSIVYDSQVNPTFTFTPSTTNGYGGFTDPSVPSTPTYSKTVSDGSTPVMGDGSSLPDHGAFGTGQTWQEFKLGDFVKTDSPVADFSTTFPSPTLFTGQINVYSISVSGVPADTEFHFDAYDHIYLNNAKVKYVNAPFSHDAGFTTVPEPSIVLLFGIGVACLGACRLKKRAKG